MAQPADYISHVEIMWNCVEIARKLRGNCMKLRGSTYLYKESNYVKLCGG
jgi:hypothetical protein